MAIANAMCPNCGSSDVRWRRRRLYDVILTYLRYVVDTVASTVFGGTRTTIIGPSYSQRANQARLEAMEYAEERKVYEDRVGTMTASCFWKCRSCKHNGQVFDNLDPALSERQRLIGLEDRIEGQLGGVNNPIRPSDPHAD